MGLLGWLGFGSQPDYDNEDPVSSMHIDEGYNQGIRPASSGMQPYQSSMNIDGMRVDYTVKEYRDGGWFRRGQARMGVFINDGTEQGEYVGDITYSENSMDFGRVKSDNPLIQDYYGTTREAIENLFRDWIEGTE
jgi:hypothetical protein